LSADTKPERLGAPCEQIHLAAHPEVAELVARPPLPDLRIVGDDAATSAAVCGCRRAGEKQGTRVAIDSCDQRPVAKQFKLVPDAVAEGHREPVDVRKSLSVVGVDLIEADRPLLVQQDFCGGHEPQTGITGGCGRRLPALLVVCSGGLGTLGERTCGAGQDNSCQA
jgi:hypothetical protein